MTAKSSARATLRHARTRDQVIRRARRKLHASAAAEAQGDEATLQAAIADLDRVVELRTIGRHEEAETLCRGIVEIFETQLGKGSPDVANALITLGGIYDEQGRHLEGRTAYERADAIMAPFAKVQNKDVCRLRAQARHYLANSFRLDGQYEHAGTMLREVLEEARRTLGENDSDVASIWNSIGMVGKYTGHWAEGIHAYLEALRILRGIYGSESAELSSIFHNLGGIEHARGRYRRALPFAREAVRLRRQALGEDHLGVAADMGALGGVLDALGRHDESLPLYFQAIGIYERHSGPSAYELAIYYNNVAAVYFGQGRLEDAERLYLSALEIKVRHHGREHPDVGMTLNNLGLLYAELGRLEEAQEALRGAVAIFGKKLEPGHPRLELARKNLAGLAGQFSSTP